MDERLADAVFARARGGCEYCLLFPGLYPTLFHYDHVIAKQHGGPTVLGNLAYACAHCNRHKGTNLCGIDRVTSRTKLIRLFNPRRHRWAYHFAFEGPHIVGRTPIGRVTVYVLAFNDAIQVPVRAHLIREGVWPPPDVPPTAVTSG